jgi:DNA topoisomerase I
MRHQGVTFPPEYEPRGLAIRIKNNILNLEPLQEEMLMAWAKKIGTPYVEDPVFQENFLASLREAAQREHWAATFEGVAIADMDWTELQRIADGEKLANMPEEQRKAESAKRKQLREELKAKYGHALVDGNEVEIGAYLVEPPGIFMGRGAHPLRGKWKRRVYSYQVTLNLDEEAEIPPAPHTPPGEDNPRWDDIVHDHDSLWIARWKDELSDKIKYVWLAETSHLRQEREKEKYEKATKLAEYVQMIREEIAQGMQSPDAKRRKVATVVYLIDKLAMRVGDEKDEDEADTVGATTLRVEHVKILPDKIKFDFLGKDSVRWEKSLPINSETEILAVNLDEFSKDKRHDQQIFEDIDSGRVNDFLRSLMPGLSAKVFRTYHATTAVQSILDQNMNLNGASSARKDYIAKLANLEAAIKCNHKRTPPKTWAESLKKKEEAVKKLRAAKPDLSKLEQQLAARQAALDKLNEAHKQLEEEAPRLIRQKEETLAKLEARPEPQARKAHAAWNKRRQAARQALREAKQANQEKSKKLKERIAKAKEALQKAKEARQHAQSTYRERLEKAERQLELAKRTRDYNLNTSLKNYIDPRVYRRWGDRVGYDWTRLYTKTLQRKFAWAKEDTNGDGAGIETPSAEYPTGDDHAPR